MIYVALPAYNEEKNIPPLLSAVSETLKGADYKVVIVDDGSTDGTLSAARLASGVMPVEVIPHEKNMGLGAAIKTLFAYIAKNVKSGDVVVTMDADNTHPAALIPSMASRVAEGADIVIASRFCAGAKTRGVPFYRNLLSRVAALIFKIAFRIRGVNDYTSGYRVISGAILRRYFDSPEAAPLVTEAGFTAGTEILIKLSRQPGARIVEAPLDLRYDLKGGASKMKVVSTMIKYLKLLRMAFK
ncbi:MAG: hypothetical protein CVU77_02965 [Elusimicrobia bacterium HGW-Elusimicrobia-1]|jgi:dolichol-phosphate mannosyltransferase|nr:MAG: hypothetical protein CVU77_02965 [Elusimicrobia bacterium HGW-Elusimicrobia-1]